MKSILFIAIFIIFSKHQICASSIDDVAQAISNFDDYTLLKQGELHLLMNEQAAILRTQLNEMQNLTLQEIENKFENINEKIITMVQNVGNTTGSDAKSCFDTMAQQELQQFKIELTGRLQECYGSMISQGNYKLYSTWNKLWQDYDFSYMCSYNSYIQCKNYQTENCADYVLDSINVSRDQTEKRFEILKTEMINNILSMTYPCREMIVQELALYPALILKYVSSCLKTITSHAFVLTCQ